MTQLALFDAPAVARPAKPATAMLLAMSGDHALGGQPAPATGTGPCAVPMSMRGCADYDDPFVNARIGEILLAAGRVRLPSCRLKARLRRCSIRQRPR